MFCFHTTQFNDGEGGSSTHFGFLKLNWPSDWWLVYGPAIFDLTTVAFIITCMIALFSGLV